MSTAIRLLLADDHAIVRMGLKAVFEFEPDLKVVAEAATAEETLSRYAECRPDVVLLDLRMPGGGIEAIRLLCRRDPSARVLVLTTSDLEEDMHRSFQAGAKGYVLKATPPELLPEAIRTVHAGAQWIPSEVARKLADRSSTQELSPRELEVLQLVIKGLTNPEITVALGISLGTVKAHLRSILEKLQVSDRTEAAAEAYRRGLVEG